MYRRSWWSIERLCEPCFNWCIWDFSVRKWVHLGSEIAFLRFLKREDTVLKAKPGRDLHLYFERHSK